MFEYGAVVLTNGEPVIYNVATGEQVKTYTNKNGRLCVYLTYNGKRHHHTFAHAWVCINKGILEYGKMIHVHHIDGNRVNDMPQNWTTCSAAIHRKIHKVN